MRVLEKFGLFFLANTCLTRYNFIRLNQRTFSKSFLHCCTHASLKKSLESNIFPLDKRFHGSLCENKYLSMVLERKKSSWMFWKHRSRPDADILGQRKSLLEYLFFVESSLRKGQNISLKWNANFLFPLLNQRTNFRDYANENKIKSKIMTLTCLSAAVASLFVWIFNFLRVKLKL